MSCALLHPASVTVRSNADGTETRQVRRGRLEPAADVQKRLFASIEYVADHLGHKNIQNTRIYAQIATSLRQEVFAKLERHPKIVRVV